MRVLLTIHHELDRHAGAAGVTVQLAEALRAAGHDADVFSWSDLPARLGAREREALFPAFVTRQIRTTDADVVDASTADAWPWLVARELAGARRRGPLVVTRTHGLEHTFRDARTAQARAAGEAIPPLERLYHGFWRLRETELTLRLADAALFLNAADRDRAIASLGVPEARAHRIANGLPDALVGLPEPRPRAAGAPLRVAQVGGWDVRKGSHVTVAAFDRLLRARADLTLTLLGVGDRAVDAREAFAPEVRERVTVVARFEREALPEHLAGHDVLVQPSLAEGFSLSLVEAMACGLAPVASAVGSAPDLLGAGDAGVLVPAGDAAALVAAIERLAADRPRLDALRAGAHRRAQDLGWTRIAQDTVALYRRAAAARS